MSIAEKITRAKTDLDNVYEAGKKEAYHNFWDIYQQSGERTNYHSAFAGEGWTADTFKPKYDIRPTSIQNIFASSAIEGDMVAILEDLGIVFDTANTTVFSNAFQGSRFSHIGTIDTRNGTTLSNTFTGSSRLITFDKLIISEHITFSSAFGYIPNLENFTIEGVIGQNGFNMQWSTKLNKKSVLSIINALSPSATAKSITLSLAAVNKAFETSPGANDGAASDEWANVVVERLNWTISLV